MENIVNGLILIDKPAGPTSFDVVRKARKALGVKKVGHLGTLDPFATGLLPLALGEGTKLAQFLLEEPKTYRATLKLGEETDTQDLTGQVTARSERLPSPEDIREAAARFVGEIEQTPPMYSAVHHEGERLYKLARRGETVAAAPRRVTIYELDVEDVSLPEATVRVMCGKGTYIRTLAHDLGRALGCGAHLTALRRLAVGPFEVDAAVGLDELTGMAREALGARIIPLSRSLPGLKALTVGLKEARRLSQGQAVPAPVNGLADGERVRVLAGEELVAVAAVRRDEHGWLVKPVRVFKGAG